MVALELDDIQGNILKGYGFAQAAYLFFEVADQASGRDFLGDLVDGVQNAATWGAVKPNTTTNIAVTYAGLRALGVAARVLDALPAAFCQPIRERAAQLLDDSGPSAPEHWDGGIGTERSHVLVTVNARKGSEAEFGTAVARIRSAAEARGAALIHEQTACGLENRREHFGWADGFSQPGVEGASSKPSSPGDGTPETDGTWRDLKAGEFVLGYPDEDGQTVGGPAGHLLRNGTYMVYRKLYQDVARFRKRLYDDAQCYGASLSDQPRLDPDQLYELMAAKVVGRWRDGESIELTPRRTDDQSRSLGGRAVDRPSNNFRYLHDDDNGFKCPTGAHIRRTNPRDSLGWKGDGRMALRHRIIRRGMPYGPFLPMRKGEDNDGLTDDGEDRGLIFICFNASLDRQFETIQRQWCNDGNAFRLGNDKDYLLGDTARAIPATVEGTSDAAPDGRVSTGRVTIPGSPPHFVHAESPVVLTRGCEYLLLPGISALRALAGGAWEAGSEGAPEGEAKAIARIVETTKAKFEGEYAGGDRPVRRDQHAKAHGCVRGEFVVGADVPADLRHGVLQEPGTYPAWIRFSSSAGAPKPRPDSKRDAHGMAIKLMGVGGDKVMGSERDAGTQDFILANSRVFFCRNAEDYVTLAAAAAHGKFLSFFLGWNPAKWRLRELLNVLIATQQKVDDPLQTQYWSQTPYALGPHAVKYAATPTSAASLGGHGSGSPNYLQDAMVRRLASGDSHFDFMVQLQTDPARMPVEDPTQRWSERRSPFRKVATIRIPSQDFTSEERRTFAENLSFTPWHALPEHQPLGGINRVRRAVYDTISEVRHGMNGVPRQEPNPDEGM